MYIYIMISSFTLNFLNFYFVVSLFLTNFLASRLLTFTTKSSYTL